MISMACGHLVVLWTRYVCVGILIGFTQSLIHVDMYINNACNRVDHEPSGALTTELCLARSAPHRSSYSLSSLNWSATAKPLQ